jgi:hypothetical protein
LTISEKPMIAFNGVRSSLAMLARNLLLAWSAALPFNIAWCATDGSLFGLLFRLEEGEARKSMFD